MKLRQKRKVVYANSSKTMSAYNYSNAIELQNCLVDNGDSTAKIISYY